MMIFMIYIKIITLVKVVRENEKIKFNKKLNKFRRLRNLDKFIKNGFIMAKQNNVDNWGVYPAENPFL